MKKRVLSFFVLLAVFAFALMLLELVYYGGMTGRVISNSMNIYESTNEGEFGIILDNYKVLGNSMRVYYWLNELDGRDQEISLHFKFFQNDKLLGEGNELVVLNKKTTKKFAFEFPIPEKFSGDFELMLAFSNGKVLKEASIRDTIFTAGGTINGNVILEQGIKTISVVASILVIVMLVLFLAARYYRRKQAVRNLGKNLQGNLIKLDFDKRHG